MKSQKDLLLHCLMDKSTLILVIYNMKNKYLCFSLLGICQALTLNISSKQSNEKLTIGPNCSPLEFAFDLVSANFGVDGVCSLSPHHMLGGSKPPNFTKFQITQFYCTKNWCRLSTLFHCSLIIVADSWKTEYLFESPWKLIRPNFYWMKFTNHDIVLLLYYIF